MLAIVLFSLVAVMEAHAPSSCPLHIRNAIFHPKIFAYKKKICYLPLNVIVRCGFPHLPWLFLFLHSLKQHLFIMKKTLLLLLALTFCSLCAQAGDDEKEKIIVTLNDGSTVEGYEVDNLGTRLKSRFRKTGSIPNSIKISPEPDGKNAKTYKADDIQGYKIVGDTTILFESQDFDALIPFVKDAKMRGLFQVAAKRPNGTIYVYQTYSSVDSKNTYVSWLSGTYGVKLRGDDRVYNIVVNGKIDIARLLIALKDKGPEKLATVYEDFFDNEEHCDMFLKDPTVLITVYDNYLKANPPISRKEKDKE